VFSHKKKQSTFGDHCAAAGDCNVMIKDECICYNAICGRWPANPLKRNGTEKKWNRRTPARKMVLYRRMRYVEGLETKAVLAKKRRHLVQKTTSMELLDLTKYAF